MHQRESYVTTADADATAFAIASPLGPTLFVPVSKLVSIVSKLGPKALGECCLGGELFKLCPHVFPAACHPIAPKVVSTCVPPIQWAG
eukprot:1548992-Karenia_brevis.AAC.1